MSVNLQQSNSCPIPSRFDPSKGWPQHPDALSQTPGGTLFSTTPGGTRIVYDRKFLLECRNSPMARTPPCFLPHIPGVTTPSLGTLPETHDPARPFTAADDHQFVMDI